MFKDYYKTNRLKMPPVSHTRIEADKSAVLSRIAEENGIIPDNAMTAAKPAVYYREKLLFTRRALPFAAAALVITAAAISGGLYIGKNALLDKTSGKDHDKAPEFGAAYSDAAPGTPTDIAQNESSAPITDKFPHTRLDTDKPLIVNGVAYDADVSDFEGNFRAIGLRADITDDGDILLTEIDKNSDIVPDIWYFVVETSNDAQQILTDCGRDGNVHVVLGSRSAGFDFKGTDRMGIYYSKTGGTYSMNDVCDASRGGGFDIFTPLHCEEYGRALFKSWIMASDKFDPRTYGDRDIFEDGNGGYVFWHNDGAADKYAQYSVNCNTYGLTNVIYGAEQREPDDQLIF